VGTFKYAIVEQCERLPRADERMSLKGISVATDWRSTRRRFDLGDRVVYFLRSDLCTTCKHISAL
jgi:hypothetical protein